LTSKKAIDIKIRKTVQSNKQTVNDAMILEWLETPSTFDKGFSWMLKLYQERIYWHIRRMVVSHEDANDVVQNTFMKAYKGIKNFKGNAKLYTWLYRIATNEALTFLQKRKRRQTASLDVDDNHLANQLKADIYFDGNEIQRKLQLALNTLPEKQRLVFNMRYFDEMPYKDISDVLGTSVGGLKASYHHAVKKIEQFLKG
jgi:RNA polymerase sigma-70 factor (ECF subfamily)